MWNVLATCFGAILVDTDNGHAGAVADKGFFWGEGNGPVFGNTVGPFFRNGDFFLTIVKDCIHLVVHWHLLITWCKFYQA